MPSHGIFGDAFKQMEETLSAKVADLVRERDQESTAASQALQSRGWSRGSLESGRTFWWATDANDEVAVRFDDPGRSPAVHESALQEHHMRETILQTVNAHLDSELPKRLEALSDSLWLKVRHAMEEQRMATMAKHSELEEQAKEIWSFRREVEEEMKSVLACRGEVENVRQDLITRQQALMTERRVLSESLALESARAADRERQAQAQAALVEGAAAAVSSPATIASSWTTGGSPLLAVASEAASASGPATLEKDSDATVALSTAEPTKSPEPDELQALFDEQVGADSGEKEDNVQVAPPEQREERPLVRTFSGVSASFFFDDALAGVGKQEPAPFYSRVFFKVMLALLPLACAVTMAVYAYPFITVGMLTILVFWVLYLAGETPLIKLVESGCQRPGRCNTKLVYLAKVLRTVQWLRSTHENDYKIKALLFSLLACLVLFNPDTGVLSHIFDSSQPLKTILIFAGALLTSTYLASWIVQVMHDRAIRRRVSRSADSPRGSQALEECMREINACLQETRGSRRRLSQRRIYDILALSDTSMLNDLLERMSLSGDCSLVRVMRHFSDTADHAARSELIDLLCTHRVNCLSLRSKSAVLHTLMVLKLSSCSGAELGVEQLLVSAQGDDLSSLKSLHDGQGNVHSMHKLLFQDVTDEALRTRVLNHFLAEGLAQVAQRALKGSEHFRGLMDVGRKLNCVPEHLGFFFFEEQALPSSGAPRAPLYNGDCGHSWLKIVTDMDDTLQCSGGRWPAGIDTRYPRHTVYPGATAFFREVERGAMSCGSMDNGSGDGHRKAPGQLVALSARPHIIGEVVETGIFKTFKRLMESNGLHTMPALLTGSVDAGAEFLLTGGDENGLRALATKKLQNVREYLALYPEFRIVFVGDNGQADHAVGQMICKEFPQNVEQVWIHAVQPKEKTWLFDKEDSDPRVGFFDDYIMAAVSATTRVNPLVSPQGLGRIVKDATEDFKRIVNWPSEDRRETEAIRLNQSIEHARQVLRDRGVDIGELELLDGGMTDADTPAGSDQDPAAPNAPASRQSLIKGWRRRSSALQQPAGTETGQGQQADNEAATADQSRSVSILKMARGLVSGAGSGSGSLPSHSPGPSQIKGTPGSGTGTSGGGADSSDAATTILPPLAEMPGMPAPTADEQNSAALVVPTTTATPPSTPKPSASESIASVVAGAPADSAAGGSGAATSSRSIFGGISRLTMGVPFLGPTLPAANDFQRAPSTESSLASSVIDSAPTAEFVEQIRKRAEEAEKRTAELEDERARMESQLAEAVQARKELEELRESLALREAGIGATPVPNWPAPSGPSPPSSHRSDRASSLLGMASRALGQVGGGNRPPTSPVVTSVAPSLSGSPLRSPPSIQPSKPPTPLISAQQLVLNSSDGLDLALGPPLAIPQPEEALSIAMVEEPAKEQGDRPGIPPAVAPSPTETLPSADSFVSPLLTGQPSEGPSPDSGPSQLFRAPQIVSSLATTVSGSLFGSRPSSSTPAATPTDSQHDDGASGATSSGKPGPFNEGASRNSSGASGSRAATPATCDSGNESGKPEASVSEGSEELLPEAAITDAGVDGLQALQAEQPGPANLSSSLLRITRGLAARAAAPRPIPAAKSSGRSPPPQKSEPLPAVAEADAGQTLAESSPHTPKPEASPVDSSGDNEAEAVTPQEAPLEEEDASQKKGRMQQPTGPASTPSGSPHGSTGAAAPSEGGDAPELLLSEENTHHTSATETAESVAAVFAANEVAEDVVRSLADSVAGPTEDDALDEIIEPDGVHHRCFSCEEEGTFQPDESNQPRALSHCFASFQSFPSNPSLPTSEQEHEEAA